MKKFFILLSITLMGLTTTHAQIVKSGSLSVLNDQTQVNMVCDFKNCTIDKKPSRVVMAKYPEWNKGVTEITARFNSGQMEKNKYEMDFGNFPEAKYTLTYYLADIDDDQDCKGTMILTETATGEVVATIEKANGKAGSFGSFFNLLGDAFENLGKKIGKLISSGK